VQRGRRKTAAWSNDYMAYLLFGNQASGSISALPELDA
jgi:hypothetical protein